MNRLNYVLHLQPLGNDLQCMFIYLFKSTHIINSEPQSELEFRIYDRLFQTVLFVICYRIP